MINQPYASLDRLIELGYGANAEEVCQNLIGKVDQIENPDSSEGEAWDDIPQVHITAARVQHDPTSMYPYYVYVDGEEIGQG